MSDKDNGVFGLIDDLFDYLFPPKKVKAVKKEIQEQGVIEEKEEKAVKTMHKKKSLEDREKEERGSQCVARVLVFLSSVFLICSVLFFEDGFGATGDFFSSHSVVVMGLIVIFTLLFPVFLLGLVIGSWMLYFKKGYQVIIHLHMLFFMFLILFLLLGVM
ncbi:hypothetical protein COB57_03585 [Candidatus Peregrinibacteria bacterium]|nr:MAG: hypothetical protein COB57_03585 [Candidatus Peregrinibacteria bacterium]